MEVAGSIAFWAHNFINGLVYVPLSANNVKDVTNEYDDIINGLVLRHISCFLSQYRESYAKKIHYRH
jgi:hypothetical protein